MFRPKQIALAPASTLYLAVTACATAQLAVSANDATENSKIFLTSTRQPDSQ